MQQSLDMFNRVVTALLADEAEKPLAEYIPSSDVIAQMGLDVADEGIGETELEDAVKALVMTSPRTATPGFFNQLFGGRQEKAVLGDLLAVVLNNSMYTYKAAGPMIGVEKVMTRKICDMIGWDEKAGGTLGPGGSMTNFMGMLMARDHFKPKTRFDGVRDKMTVYTSKESHYSIPKNASFAGIGRDNVRHIKTDGKGRMDMAALREVIMADKAAGSAPVMINCTAGTTVLGAYDDLTEAGKIAREFDIWLHVDGAYGGAAIFSDKYRHLIAGVEHVDSFTVNAHKMLGTPLSCSLILVRDKANLLGSFSHDASYLYQTDHDEFNPGKMSLQCGRRNDALKFWVLWKSVGTKGLAQIVEHQFALAEMARDYVRGHADYTDYSQDDTVAICFNYKDIPAKAICTALYERGELMVGYGSFEGDQFIRLVTVNATNSEDDIRAFFEKLERFVGAHYDMLKAA